MTTTALVTAFAGSCNLGTGGAFHTRYGLEAILALEPGARGLVRRSLHSIPKLSGIGFDLGTVRAA
ncbi:hypothetical protein [Halopiger xanaduensis]|uniref:hypothetical protein n=1 Tax=Halopiger xanaduensis TaxID=387343 RepID=UPI000677880B|nr:hypothetical protein [Halopiger xanaduensis]